MRLAREGWPFVVAGWGLLALATWAALRWGGWVWVMTGLWAAVAVWLLVFFRDPVRQGPRGEHLIIAPADGQVVSIIEAHEPMFVRGMTTRVSIFMNVFDVHVNRYPASGTVEIVQYNPGRFLHAGGEKASLDNEQASIGIRTGHGPVLIRQIAGLVARRIVTDSRPGDRVVQGERMGMIRFGSRVDVFVPTAARPLVRVQVGDRVLAGATIVMELPT